MRHFLGFGGGLALLLLVTGGASTAEAQIRGGSGKCDDGEFLRRTMLALVGYPPNREQVKVFWNDPDPKKRSKKIDELLDTPEFADLLTRRIMTFLFEGNYHSVGFDGVKPDLTGGAKGRIVADFHHFLKIRIAKDRPWDQIVYEILDARGTTMGDPALGYKLSFYRGDGYKAESVSGISRHFLGVRILCARCHDHPFMAFTENNYTNMEAFFDGQRGRGITPSKKEKDNDGNPRMENAEILDRPGGRRAVFLYGGSPGKADEPTAALAKFMTAKSNLQLPMSFVNRAWSWIFGQGVINPVDDFNLVNIRQAGKDFNGVMKKHTLNFRKDYSIKGLFRDICNSDVFQRDCNREHQKYNPRDPFGKFPIYQMSAEQLVQSLAVAKTGRPLSQEQAVAKARQVGNDLFPPGAVWCETTPLLGSTPQSLYLRNGGEAQAACRGPVLNAIKSENISTPEKVREMFLAALNRLPRESEVKRFTAYIERKGGNGFEDAYWAILNSSEFMTIH